MVDIQKPRDTWYVTNISTRTVSINDLPKIIPLKQNKRIDLLKYTYSA